MKKLVRLSRLTALLCLAILLAQYLSGAGFGWPSRGAAQTPTVPPQNPKPTTKDAAPKPPPKPTDQRGINVSADKATPPTKTTENVAAPTAEPLWDTGGQAYALIVGVSKYPNLEGRLQLRYADADAQALADFLTSRHGGFPRENVTLLINETATRANIVESLSKLREVSKDSVVLIYFAGHGEVFKARQEGADQGLLLPYDFQLSTPVATAVEMESFNNIVKKISARSIVVITDACKSGTISAGATQTVRNVAIRDVAESEPTDYRSTFVLTAATPTQSSIELEQLGHGVFTHHLLEGLRGAADRDQNGLVTAEEIFPYVRTRVLETTGRQQEPENNTGFDTSIPLAIVNESGLPVIRKWFESDPLVARLVAHFDDSLRQNRLTAPQGMNAYSYYRRLREQPRTPSELAEQKRGELLDKLRAAAREQILAAPRDPALWEKTVDWLDKANDLTPDKDRSLVLWLSYSRGMRAYYTDSPQRAAREFADTLRKLEDDRLVEPHIAHQIALVFNEAKQPDEAIRAYQLAVATQPPIGWRVEFATLLVSHHKFAAAEEQWRLALAAQDDYQPALRGLAEVLLDEAASTPDKLPARRAEALPLATRAHTLAATDIEAVELYSRALLANQKVAEALPLLRQVATARLTDPRRDQALWQLSQAYVQTGAHDRAIAALREAERRGSQTAPIYALLGRLYAAQGDLERARAATQQAVAFASDDKHKKAHYLRQLAEYLERAGSLTAAAIEYRNAADQAVGDNRLKEALATHALVLDYRAGTKRAGNRQAVATTAQRPTIAVPGGIAALERLTGLKLEGRDEAVALIFETVLFDDATRKRLIGFFDFYPDFLRQAERLGGNAGEIVLPASNQTAPDKLREVLRFFGVQDKKGARDIVHQKDFDNRLPVLAALGGDPAQFKQGASVTLRWKNEQLPLLLGLEQWLNTKEGLKLRENRNAPASDYWLYLLRNDDRLKLYVGAAQLPEGCAKPLLTGITPKDKEGDVLVAASLYFAAPYLRFTPQGQLVLPGGERLWQEAFARALAAAELLPALFRAENGGLLYLLAVLSAAGPVGDTIAASVSFKRLSLALQKAPLPAGREPFDLLDLLAQLRLEGKDTLRLAATAEIWLGVSGNVWPTLADKLGGIAPGQSLLLTRQLAVLAQVEREQPAWANHPTLLKLIAQAVANRRDGWLAMALALRLTPAQCERYATRRAALEAPPALVTTEKNKKSATPAPEQLAALQAQAQADQAAFELLALLARRGALSHAQTAALAERLLALAPNGENFALDIFNLVQEGMLGLPPNAEGAAVESALLTALSQAAPLVLPASQLLPANERATAPALLAAYDPQPVQRAALEIALAAQKHTRPAALAQALAALRSLAGNGDAATALPALRSALGQFVLATPPPDPKQKKSKEPVNATPPLLQLAAELSVPASPAALRELRRQLAPVVGETLRAVLNAAHQSADGEHSPLFTAWRDALQLVDIRALTPAANEYVARLLDLGEEVLARAAARQPEAERTLHAGLNVLLSPRRAALLWQTLEQGEVKTACGQLTPSELYFLGQRYLAARRQSTPLEELAAELGALGALAQALRVSTATPPDAVPDAALNDALRQFGMPMTARAGLARLALTSLEPYEQTRAFAHTQRLAERGQDVQLSLARLSARRGLSAPLVFQPALLNAIWQAAEQAARPTAGSLAPPPARDWQGRQAACHEQLLEATLHTFLLSLNQTPHRRWLTDATWDDAAPPQR